MTVPVPYDIHFLEERGRDAPGIGDTSLENDLAEAESSQAHEGFSDCGKSRGHRGHPCRPRAACYAATPSVVVGIDGEYSGDMCVALGSQDQSNDSPDGDPTQHHVMKIEGVEKLFDGARKKLGVVARLRNVRIAMTRVIEREDGERVCQVRHDL